MCAKPHLLPLNSGGSLKLFDGKCVQLKKMYKWSFYPHQLYAFLVGDQGRGLASQKSNGSVQKKRLICIGGTIFTPFIKLVIVLLLLRQRYFGRLLKHPSLVLILLASKFKARKFKNSEKST